MQIYNEWFELFRQELGNIDAIQVAVLVLGVTEVLLARANNIWLYPTGIASVSLAIFSLFNAQLYAECLLHAYYLVMSVYGWWYWSGKKNHAPVEIAFSTRKEWFVTLSISFGGSIILFLFLTYFTDSEVPAWDAWVSGTGWAGMWLLARRKIENWLLLNISNAFAIPLLFHKGLPMLGLLTIFLFGVACKGYFDWVKIARKKLAGEKVHAS
ncbi:MAG TPA: nicotinamide riboside transporter PnuC [Chryseolinea sp.]